MMVTSLCISFVLGSVYAFLAREHHIMLLGSSGRLTTAQIALSAIVRFGLVGGMIAALFVFHGRVTTTDALSIVVGYIIMTIWLNRR